MTQLFAEAAFLPCIMCGKGLDRALNACGLSGRQTCGSRIFPAGRPRAGISFLGVSLLLVIPVTLSADFLNVLHPQWLTSNF